MNRDDAEEYTQALGQVVAGGWRQVALGQRLGVPEALGISTAEWVEQRLGGYVRLSIPERREAVAELVGGEKPMSNRQAADVLGVDESTIREDRKAAGNPASESPVEEKPQPALAAPAALAGNPAPTPAINPATGREFPAWAKPLDGSEPKPAEPVPSGTPEPEPEPGPQPAAPPDPEPVPNREPDLPPAAFAAPTPEELHRRRPRSRSVRAEPAVIPEEFAAHPVLALFPPMTVWERAGLLASVRRDGLAVPIVTMPDGRTILDGRERLAACVEAEVPLRVQVYDGADPAGTVLALNGLRYHRSPREVDQLVHDHPELEVDEGALTAAEARRLIDKLRGTLGDLSEARESLAAALAAAPEEDRAELAETLALADRTLAITGGAP